MNSPTIIRLAINSVRELEMLEDRFGIKYYCSITKTLRDLMEKLIAQFDEISVRFPIKFVAPSYQKFPQLFEKQLQKYAAGYQVRISKEGETLLLRAGYGVTSSKFATCLWDELRTEDVVARVVNNIPPAYVKQPHALLCRFRKRGLDLKIIRLGSIWKFAKKSCKFAETKQKQKQTQTHGQN